MSPIINGHMYTSLTDDARQVRQLNILLLGDITDEQVVFFDNLAVLRNYLGDIASNVKNNLHVANADASHYDAASVMTTIADITYAAVRDYGMENDVDVIVDVHASLVCDETKAYNVEFGYVDSVQGLYEQCEAFLAGNGVAWLMSEPTWHDHWIRVYFYRDGLPKTAMEYMNSITSSDTLEAPAKEKMRHLANRFAQIDYGKSLLKYYILLKRKEHRKTNSQQIVSFEVNYHLGNYYFLMAGVFDILARYINMELELGITAYKHLAVEKPVFTDRLATVNPELATLFTEDEFHKWLIWLKDRRNFISHDATISLTSIVKEPEIRMSEPELNAAVEGTMDWEYMLTFMPREIVNTQKLMIAELIKIGEYDVELEDAMLLRDSHSEKIFLPLNSLDHDYDKMAEVMRPALVILAGLHFEH